MTYAHISPLFGEELRAAAAGEDTCCTAAPAPCPLYYLYRAARKFRMRSMSRRPKRYAAYGKRPALAGRPAVRGGWLQAVYCIRLRAAAEKARQRASS